MKGRIICPKCGHHIIADINKDVPAFSLDCPECNHHFKVKTSQVEISNVDLDSEVDVEADCDWEEHGEPRKTILSSIKPRTDRPMVASFILIIIVLIGIISAFFPTVFLQAPIGVASLVGAQGDVSIHLDNSSVISIDNLSVSIDQHNVTFVQQNNSFFASSLQLGQHQLTITHTANNSGPHTVTKQVYLLPFNLSTYTITVTDTNPLSIKDESLELGWLSSIIIILSIVVLIGAFMCWRRKYSDVALIGSLVGILTVGIYFSGLILGVIAFWLILNSRDEFDDGKKGKSF